MEIEALALPRELQNLQRLQGASEALLSRHAEAVELFLTIALPDPEPNAAARDHVDDRDILGEFQRMLKGREQHEGSDLDALGARRDCRGRGHHRGKITVVGEVMLGEPNRIEPGCVGDFGLSEHLGIDFLEGPARVGRIAKIQLVTNFYLAHGIARKKIPPTDT